MAFANKTLQGNCYLIAHLPIKSARTDKAPMQSPPNAAAVGMYLKDFRNYHEWIIKMRQYIQVDDMRDCVIQYSSQGVCHKLFT